MYTYHPLSAAIESMSKEVNQVNYNRVIQELTNAVEQDAAIVETLPTLQDVIEVLKSKQETTQAQWVDLYENLLIDAEAFGFFYESEYADDGYGFEIQKYDLLNRRESVMTLVGASADLAHQVAGLFNSKTLTE